MDPAFLGRIHCFDVDKQCVLGEENTHRLMQNQKLKQAFDQSCAEVKGNQIRCCPLSLINKPYNPPQDGSVVPIHVKFENGLYNACPEGIRSQCAREKPEDVGLCVAQKCNDAGYLEAENYYQVCKAYRQKGERQRVPDCSKNNCEAMMTLPAWFKEELATGRASLAPDASAPATATTTQPVPGGLQVPPQQMPKKPMEEVTLDKFFMSLPQGNDFYKWAAIVLGIIALFIIVFVFLSRPKGTATGSTTTSGSTSTLSGWPSYQFPF